MASKLKVFRYSDGLHAWTVAASSRAKALAAWGMTRDLFKDGSAEEIDHGADFEAALTKPGELIERGLKVDLGKAKVVKAKTQNKSAVRAVKVLEDQLEAFDADQAERFEDFDGKIAALQKQRAEAEETNGKARAALIEKLKAARAKV